MDGGKWCYPGTDILINKYGIKDKESLDKFEIQKFSVQFMSLQLHPEVVLSTCNEEHLTKLNNFLFGDIYEWAGQYRDENIFKAERVLSGGSAEYSDPAQIKNHLNAFFEKYNAVDWKNESALAENVTSFLSELWTIHPFREGNTRTCTTYMWHFLQAKNIKIDLELLRKNPMYVRDSLVMANYDQPGYLFNIIKDALSAEKENIHLDQKIGEAREKYKIAKEDYQAFKEKYSIKKDDGRDK